MLDYLEMRKDFSEFNYIIDQRKKKILSSVILFKDFLILNTSGFRLGVEEFHAMFKTSIA